MNVGGTTQLAVSILMVACGVINYASYEISWTIRQNTNSKVVVFLADLSFMLNSAVTFLSATHYGYQGIITYYTLLCFGIGNGIARICFAKFYRKIILIIMRWLNKLKKAQKIKSAIRMAKSEECRVKLALSSTENEIFNRESLAEK